MADGGGDRAGEKGFEGFGWRASGEAGPECGLPAAALVEVVVGDGLGLGGIELG